jgi:hypothetical protein
MFSIAERLHQPVTVVEAMSPREVWAWLDYWTPQPAVEEDDAIELSSLSRDELRSMFPGRH